jgi:proton-coupled amino acid transporter
MANLGWVGGPICFVVFSLITLYTAQLLVDLYIIDGKRQRTYSDTVTTVFGRKGTIAIGIVQQSNLVLTALAYTITAGNAIKSLATSYCKAHNTSTCFNSFTAWTVIFGVLQLFMSQLPNLEQLWWASAIGALCSFGYATIILILSCIYIDPQNPQGDVQGFTPLNADGTVDTAQKAWNVLNAIGAILFAYSFSMVLVEIQDTIRTRKGDASGPIPLMKKAVNMAVMIVSFFYFLIGITAYAADGNNIGGDILLTFETLNNTPGWVLDLTNSLILVHMISAYQVFSQPHFEYVDLAAERTPSWPKILSGWKLRIIYRSLYVCLVTFVAILFPSFGVIVGLVGAVSIGLVVSDMLSHFVPYYSL